MGIHNGYGIDWPYGKCRERLGDTALAAATADSGAETRARATDTTPQKVSLAVRAMRLKRQAKDGKALLEESMRLFKPATALGWHRAMVRRKIVLADDIWAVLH
jgi:hypothetical protein